MGTFANTCLSRFLQGAALTALLAGGVLAEPVSLDQALARADVSAPAVAVAKAQADAAQARARQAGVIPNPELGVLSENVGGSGPYRSFDAAQTTVSINQRLELGGQRRSRTGQARAEAAVARLKLAVAHADTAEQVRVRYAEALAADARAAIAGDAATRGASLAQVSQTLVDAGREPPLRALRARSEAAAAQAQFAAAQAQSAAARRALAALWSGPGDDLQLGAADEPATATPFDPTQSLDVLVAERQVDAARAGVDRARAVNAPDVTLQAGIRRFEDSGDRALIVGASMPIPVWDRNGGGVAASRADLTGAETLRLAALAQAVRDGRDAEAALAAAQARLDAALKFSTPQAQEALDLARQGYEAGKFGLLDVMDAQAALNAARTEQVEARLALAKAQAARIRLTARE